MLQDLLFGKESTRSILILGLITYFKIDFQSSFYFFIFLKIALKMKEIRFYFL